MKKLIPAALLMLLVSACGVQPSAAEPLPETPSEPPKQALITKESLRAEYEAQGFTVREIVPYEGDFLVCYGSEPYNGGFQWIYTETGLHAPLLFSGLEVLDYEIESKGAIRVLTGGSNVYNVARSFPVYQRATASLPLTQEGEVFTDPYSSGSIQQEPYWAPLETSHTFGWEHGPNTLVDLRVTANGLEAVFGPRIGEIGSFFAAASSIPVTIPTYDSDSHTLTLKFLETTLTSGEMPVCEDAQEQAYYEDCAERYRLPTAFPTGAVSGNNDFFSAAEVRETAEGVDVTLTLTERAAFYTADWGQLLEDESRPFLRLSLRDLRHWD